MDFKELCEKREKLLNDFERTFKFSFPVSAGVIVDIERLDRQLGVPDGVSMTDYITQNYGADADRLVDECIDVCCSVAERLTPAEEIKRVGLMTLVK